MGRPFIDLSEEENWIKVPYVKRVLGRELTEAEEAEVLRVGTTAEFFQRERERRRQED